MDGQRVDELTRALAAGQTRRGFLAWAGAALGLATGVRAAVPAAAQEGADPKDAEHCAAKALAVSGDCAALDDEKEAERCRERREEFCAECPAACQTCPVCPARCTCIRTTQGAICALAGFANCDLPCSGSADCPAHFPYCTAQPGLCGGTGHHCATFAVCPT